MYDTVSTQKVSQKSSYYNSENCFPLISIRFGMWLHPSMLNSVRQNYPLHLTRVHTLPCNVTRDSASHNFQQTLKFSYEYVYSPMKAAQIHTHKSIQERTELYRENYIQLTKQSHKLFSTTKAHFSLLRTVLKLTQQPV